MENNIISTEENFDLNEKLRIPSTRTARRNRTRHRLRRNYRASNASNAEIITPEQQETQTAWIEMIASINQKRPLIGTLSGVETWNHMPCAVVFYKDIKVLIPAAEFFTELPEDNTDPNSPHFMERTMRVLYHRLGSEVEFVGTHFASQEDQLVAGSRKQALARKVRRTFMAKKRGTDEYLINEGDIVAAKVVSALPFGVLVEVGGVDYLLLPNDISYFRMPDCSQNFTNGETVKVKIVELDRKDPNNIHIRVSIKEAKPNPFENAKRILQTSSQNSDARYIGTVTYVDKRAVYVSLTTSNLQIRCFFPNDKPIPQIGARVFVRIEDINPEKSVIRGSIIHIA